MTGTTDFEIDDAPTENYPDELGLAGEPATYEPAEDDAERVTIRGTEYDVGTDTWTVWIDTGDGIEETVGEHVSEVGA